MKREKISKKLKQIMNCNGITISVPQVIVKGAGLKGNVKGPIKKQKFLWVIYITCCVRTNSILLK